MEAHLARHADFQNQAFVALNTAFLEDGGFVRVSKGVIAERPIHLVFVSTAGSQPTVTHPRNLIIADPPGYALHWFNGRELVTHWDTAEDHQVLARYDANLQGMIQHMLAERPGA